jgi:hypothetical protein
MMIIIILILILIIDQYVMTLYTEGVARPEL